MEQITVLRDYERFLFYLLLFDADLLWLVVPFCLSMIELLIFWRLWNEKCFLLWKISCAEVFSLYSFYTFKKKRIETNYNFHGNFMDICSFVLQLRVHAKLSEPSSVLLASCTFPPRPLSCVYYCKVSFCKVICAAFFLILRLSLMSPGRTQVATNELDTI